MDFDQGAWYAASVAAPAAGAALSLGIRAIAASAGGERRKSALLSTICFLFLSAAVAGAAWFLVSTGGRPTRAVSAIADAAGFRGWAAGLALFGILSGAFPRAAGIPSALLGIALMAILGSAAVAYRPAVPGQVVAVFVPHAVSASATTGDFSVPRGDGIPALSSLVLPSDKAALKVERLLLGGFFGEVFGPERYRVSEYSEPAGVVIHRFPAAPTPLDPLRRKDGSMDLPWVAIRETAGEVVAFADFRTVEYSLGPDYDLRSLAR
ncbi:MAG: hypothetical protein NT080_02455 [Spirochaetes bacterium]|nr:hypothetical protein [Spirochaetota bacterium]